MEDHSSSLLFLSLSLLTFILVISQFLKIEKRSKGSPKLPPGPWKLPIIGSIHHLSGSLPYHRLRELAQKYGPLMHLQLGEASTIVVSSPEVAKEVLKTNGPIFAQRPNMVTADIICYGSIDIVSAPYGGYWKQLRRICTLELLSGKRVRTFQSVREEEVLNLMQYISSNIGSTINLSEQVSFMTSAVTARATFGKKCKDQEAFISMINQLVTFPGRFRVTALYPSQKWLHALRGIPAELLEPM